MTSEKPEKRIELAQLKRVEVKDAFASWADLKPKVV
jgi:hypothetical protein